MHIREARAKQRSLSVCCFCCSCCCCYCAAAAAASSTDCPPHLEVHPLAALRQPRLVGPAPPLFSDQPRELRPREGAAPAGKEAVQLLHELLRARLAAAAAGAGLRVAACAPVLCACGWGGRGGCAWGEERADQGMVTTGWFEVVTFPCPGQQQTHRGSTLRRASTQSSNAPAAARNTLPRRRRASSLHGRALDGTCTYG